jgi:hypothetical protein
MEMDNCQAYIKVICLIILFMYLVFVSYCFCLCILLCVGNIHILFKDSIFEASSPTMHTPKLGRLMKKMYPTAVAVILYTDDGIAHTCKHTSVRLGLLALFLELDLDTMVVMRMAPTHSLGNLVDMVMSVLNLGLARSCSSQIRDGRSLREGLQKVQRHEFS